METITIAQKVQPYLLAPSKKSNKDRVLAVRSQEAEIAEKILQIENRLSDKKAFLPIETGPDELRKLLGRLKDEKSEIQKKLKAEEFELSRHNKHIAMARRGYRDQLDLSFLRATKRIPVKGPLSFLKSEEWPAFAIFNVNDQSRTFRIEARAVSSPYGVSSYLVGLPKPISDQYANTVNKLLAISRKNSYETVTIQASLSGIMPDTVRDRIVSDLENKVFDQVYVIAEVFEWTINVRKPIPEGDPIVIGWCDDTQQAFKIDVYDPTALESYVVDQFGFGVTD